MSLLLRADIALIVVFVLGATLTGLVCRALLERNAEHETRAQAELMMDSAFVARDYTSSEVAPLQQAALNPTNLRTAPPTGRPTSSNASATSQASTRSPASATLPWAARSIELEADRRRFLAAGRRSLQQ